MTTTLKPGDTGTSIVDGKPFKVASHDANSRSKNKRIRTRMAREAINNHENRIYYQFGSAWKQPSSEREVNERRKVQG